MPLGKFEPPIQARERTADPRLRPRDHLVPPLTFYSLRPTLCITSLKIQKFCVLPTTHLYHNKQRLFLYTALPYRFCNRGRECLLRGTNSVFKSESYIFVLKELNVSWKILQLHLLETMYEGWNFNSGNYLFTIDTK